MRPLEYALNGITYKRFASIIVTVLVFVTSLCMFGTGLFTDNIKNGADRISGTTNTDLYIVPEEYLDSTKDMLFKGKACTITFKSDVTDTVSNINGVAEVSRQLYLETLERSCCTAGGVQIVAFDPSTDFSVCRWSEDAKGLKDNEVLAGSASCYEKGEELDLFGRTFTVADVLDETGMGYDSSLFLSFNAADEITASKEYGYMFGERTGLVSMLLVRQDTDSDIDALSTEISDKLSDTGLKVYAIDQLASGLKSSIRTITRMVGIMDIFAVVIAAVSLFAMVTLTSQQRRKTAGSLLSVGCTKAKILELFFTEYLLLFAAGTILGILTALMFLLPLHGVLKAALEMPYKLISFRQAAALLGKTLGIDMLMLVTALSFTFITVMKQEPAQLTGENV
ncbi:ABC transporter permease [uncultured Ruminococcus sp.]|uniref:ABC transporter permease n=1 Tax=uncultured Ruminococcus sp. TaxID=165186 RepID=UPI0025FD983D|nr:FtsX-like permease family protein [uncultured Ruminococcus sp.]